MQGVRGEPGDPGIEGGGGEETLRYIGNGRMKLRYITLRG